MKTLPSSSITQVSSANGGSILQANNVRNMYENDLGSGMGRESYTNVTPPTIPPTPDALHTCVPSLDEGLLRLGMHSALARNTFEGAINTLMRHDFALGMAPWEGSPLSSILRDPAFMVEFQMIMVIIPESPWVIPIYANTGGSVITVGTVLNAIQAGLNTPVGDNLGDVIQQRIAGRNEVGNWKGARRVELLGSRTKFAGLSPGGEHEWVLHLA